MYLKRYGTEYSLEISSDAQVALTVIGRRTVERDENRIIDLSTDVTWKENRVE